MTGERTPPGPGAPVVSLLTDYGVRDELVGVCHAVILGICPTARIVDVTHGVPRHAVRSAAVVLRNVIGYLPSGVHVVVVDPQVGTERRAVALRCEDGEILVGPDNGVLSLGWERCGGVVEAIDVSRSPHRLEPVSATFHGRDVFAPVAPVLAVDGFGNVTLLAASMRTPTARSAWPSTAATRRRPCASPKTPA